MSAASDLRYAGAASGPRGADQPDQDQGKAHASEHGQEPPGAWELYGGDNQGDDSDQRADQSKDGHCYPEA